MLYGKPAGNAGCGCRLGTSLFFFLPRFFKGKEEEIGMATAGYEDTIENIPPYITASAQLLGSIVQLD